MSGNPPGPREAHGLDWRSWVHQAVRGELEPEGLSDAIAIAFTAACDPVLTSMENDARDSNDTQARRVAYRKLGRAVGMKPDTLRLTYQGGRWLTLPNLQKVFSENRLRLGEMFLHHLGQHLPYLLDGVLHTERISSPGPWRGRVLLMLEHEEDIPVSMVVALEEQTRDLVASLALLQRSKKRPRNAFMWDWRALDRSLDGRDPESLAATRATRAALRDAGISITGLVADVINNSSQPIKTPAVTDGVQRRMVGLATSKGVASIPINVDRVRDALSYLRKRGEIERDTEGYFATKKLRTERTGKGAQI